MTSLMVGSMGDTSVQEDTKACAPDGPTKTPSFSHALTSQEPRQSEVERVTKAIENAQDQRVVVTFNIHVALIQECRRIAIRKGYSRISRITIADLLDYRARVAKDLEQDRKRPWYRLVRLMGFRNRNEQLSRVLNRAVELVEDQAESQNDDYFHYMDFNWNRNGVMVALGYVLSFYLFTPVVFCLILEDKGVCPSKPDHPHTGWMTALYFASVTLSTVGYGDVTVDKTHKGHIAFAIIYMVIANATLVGSFSVAANNTWHPLSKWHEKMIERLLGEAERDEPMHKRLRRVYILRLTELVGGFILLNAIGVFANRAFLKQDEYSEMEWHWLASTYWAVQTTTTIGYGDLNLPDGQPFFQVFYLIGSTYFAGVAISGLSGLRAELEQIRREAAWARREVSKHLISELHLTDRKGKVDQYEFLLASLVQLGKISSEEVIPIMEKFRSLVSDDGFIAVDDTLRAGEATNQDVDAGLAKARRRDIFHSIKSSLLRHVRPSLAHDSEVNFRTIETGENQISHGVRSS